tara:strand:+ start:6319 stop:7827 length:1509 start_codon:yes stop_codon:yes gene_type:complete
VAQIIEHQQGSPEWHQHRASHYNASDAPAMMGVSSYKSRGALLHEKKTGIRPDVDAAMQRRFDLGHEYEAMARPWAEEIIGEELYPVVLADEFRGMSLSASLDGLTMDDSTAFEHKTLNENLRQCIDSRYKLPEQYRIQMEQQMLLSGARRCLFMASAGDRDDARWCWYEHDPDLRDRVVSGWTQFNADLANYEPPAAEKIVAGSAPSALPALDIRVSGSVVASNLDEFKAQALAVFQGINTDLKTDEDFANAEATVKWCKDIEKRLDGAKDAALNQTADIYAVLTSIDEIREESRKVRLNLDKQAKARKEQRKEEILRAAEHNYDAHIGSIEKDLERGATWQIHFPAPSPMIAQAMKGKKTITSLQDAADTAVANTKIEADRIAREIRASIDALKSEAEGYESLFPDGGQLVTNKTADDLRNLAKARIAEHLDQQRRGDEREAEQKRVRDDPECWNDTPATVTPGRPTDDQIIGCIADMFDVDHATARDWIAGMDMIGAEA